MNTKKIDTNIYSVTVREIKFVTTFFYPYMEVNSLTDLRRKLDLLAKFKK